jgi:uncharacterized OsmC-like protein
MVSIDMTYQGNLRFEATHGPSQTTMITDAPVDNCGKGESFSPTDLTAVSLASCIGTIMGIVAEQNDIDLSGMTIHVDKEMIADPVRRIARLPVTVNVPANLSTTDRELLETRALQCPVCVSLDPRIERPVTFHYGV